MDRRTGEIGTLARLRKKAARRGDNPQQVVKAIDPPFLPSKAKALFERSGLAYITRNSHCPCGSGKRFKKCCLLEGGN